MDKQYLRNLAAQSQVVYAPKMESFGLVPAEAMACGAPVIGIRKGGVRETVIDLVAALLVVRDPGQFANAIFYLLPDRGRGE